MPSSDPLSIFYEALSPRMTSEDVLKFMDEEPNYEPEPGNTRMDERGARLAESDDHEENDRANTAVSESTNLLNLHNGAPFDKDETSELNQDDGHVKSFSRKLSLTQQIQSFSVALLPLKAMDLETVKEIFITTLLSIWGLLSAIVLTLIPRRFRYKDVSGQVVLITGAGSGIGRLMAVKFALEHKAIVVCWDINKQASDATAKDIRSCGGKAHSYMVDVSKKENIYEVAKKVQTEVGKVDILINNAGIVSGAKFLDTKDEQIERTFQVNALSNFWTTKAFLPDMIKNDRGHIVTIASTAGLVGVNRLVDYCASKYAAVGFHESLISELKAEMGCEGINATVVCPYYINTGMFDGVSSKLLPILEPEDVVNDIVAGVLVNQETIIIPRYVLFLILSKYFIPARVGQRLQSALGITGTMLGFKGRAGEKPKTK